MSYDWPLYRPPSEANSLILQVTLGCSHNKCIFCSMYKTKRFYIKDNSELEVHLQWAKKNYPSASRIFLADGNVFTMPTQSLQKLVSRLFREFPKLERVSAYAGPLDILSKSEEELLSLREAGLSLLYLGVESGSLKVLQKIVKGVTPAEMVEAGQKVKKAGFSLSCTIISGLGGKELWNEHAIETARVISAIDPDYLGALTLLVEEEAPLSRLIQRGKFLLLDPQEVIKENILLLKNLQLSNCVFRSNHPSNYLSLKGILNHDKERLINELQSVLDKGDYLFKPETWRGL